MKLLILTDHLTHVASDSIFGLCHGLSRHGFSVYLASRGTQENREFFSGKTCSHIAARALDRDFHYTTVNQWFNSASSERIGSFDAMLLRLDSPISESWLEWLAISTTCEVVNNPLGIEKTRKREYLLELGADTITSKYLNSIDAIAEAIETEESVLKLDDTFGGSGIMRFAGNDRVHEFKSLPDQEMLRIKKNISDFGGVLLQKYTPMVNLGDKRFLVAFGKLLGSFTRTPKDNGWLCNLSQGGEISFQEHSDDEIQLVHRIDNKLSKFQVPIYGIDTLVDTDGTRKVSELNVTNPGGFIQIQEATGADIFGDVASLLEKYLTSRH